MQDFKHGLKSIRIRPGLWEVCLTDGRALGRIRHVFKPGQVGWISSDGRFYPRADEALEALAQEAGVA